MEAPKECDVLVIGGGPGGSTAAALLAEKGRHVVLLEKDRHPRFHIGESLLPRNMDLINRLGLSDSIAGYGVFKPGAEFVSDRHEQTVGFSFAEGIDPRYNSAWQVRRAEFDAALFGQACSRGAEAEQNMRVTDVRFTPGQRARVIARGADEQDRAYAPRFVIDASGRESFLAQRMRCRRTDKNGSTAAVYAHYRNAERRTGDREGYISIHFAEDGWFWMIPLPDAVMSVGFVGTKAAFREKRGSNEAFLAERIAASPTMATRMTHAERISAATATGNYSYRSTHAAGDGYLMIGDAYAFIDPVFSSGVLLAMTGGELGAQVADTWLNDARRGRMLARRCERKITHALDTLGWLIARINNPVMRDMFMSPKNYFKMREGLVSLLAGDVHGDLPRMPVLAFKGFYYGLRALAPLGISARQDAA